MAKKAMESDDILNEEEDRLASQIECSALDALPYEIIPTQGGGPASL